MLIRKEGPLSGRGRPTGFAVRLSEAVQAVQTWPRYGGLSTSLGVRLTGKALKNGMRT